jgi:hypothetical protein
MAGVAAHSGYRGDPWGRLQRTSHFLATTTFGTVPDAQAAIERVRAVHERGVPYRASDPALLRWVHVAEASSLLGAYQRYASRPAHRRGGRPVRRAGSGRARELRLPVVGPGRVLAGALGRAGTSVVSGAMARVAEQRRVSTEASRAG